MNDTAIASENRLLVIDDEPAFCAFVDTVAKDVGFNVRAARNGSEISTQLREFDPTTVMLDLNMPDTDGIELLRFLAREKYPGLIFVVSGQDSRVLAAAQQLGKRHGLDMANVMRKPIHLQDLRRSLKQVMRRKIQASELAKAIELGDVLFHYQPQFKNIGGSWVPYGAEALVRWEHPRLGMVTPKEIIPVAEESGLIAPMTDLLLQQVTEQLDAWRRRNLHYHIAVNIGANLVTDIEFPDRLGMLLDQYDLDGSELTLEITESSAIIESETFMDVFTRLRLRGVGLAIDDFGTGYSSLSQLFNMPFNELKLDGSFVKEVIDNEDARTIVRAMIQLAHNLKMVACAEWVESEEISEFLLAEKCDRAQGFHFSKPISALEFEDFCKRSAATHSSAGLRSDDTHDLPPKIAFTAPRRSKSRVGS